MARDCSAGHAISHPLSGAPGGGATFVEPCAVKFTYLRPVDYGQDNHHSPDGHMYFTAYGSSRPDGPVSWMSGDEAHLCRADPSKGPDAMNDGSAYEFYAGEDTTTGKASKYSSNLPFVSYGPTLRLPVMYIRKTLRRSIGSLTDCLASRVDR